MILKYIAIRVIPLLLMAALGYSFFMPSAGERQFTRTEAALHRAQSYRMQQTRHGNEFIEHWLLEVVCPDREHSRQTSEPAHPQWDSPQNTDIEDVDVGNRWYRRFNQAEWKTVPTQKRIHCGTIPYLQDGALPEYKYIRALGHIEKQGFDTVAGETCREWVVTLREPNGKLKVYDYCINPNDDLPRRVKVDEDSFQVTFTNWNRPIDIQQPEWPQ